jgi:hypothetical protein
VTDILGRGGDGDGGCCRGPGTPSRLPQSTIDVIIGLREKLASEGLDHGPHTCNTTTV